MMNLKLELSSTAVKGWWLKLFTSSQHFFLQHYRWLEWIIILIGIGAVVSGIVRLIFFTPTVPFRQTELPQLELSVIDRLEFWIEDRQFTAEKGLEVAPDIW